MNIVVYQNGPFMVNTYLVINEEINEAIVIDPGSTEMEPLIEKINSLQLKLSAIVSTHGHWDHVAGVNKLKEAFDAPFYINEKEKPVIDAIPMQSQLFGVPAVHVPSADVNLPDSGNIEIAGFDIKLLFTPGHSPGSVSLLFKDEVVFSGDALFNMSIGRTDLPGGSYNELMESIQTQLLTLPDDVRVMSGHGPETTIGAEKKMNPFLS